MIFEKVFVNTCTCMHLSETQGHVHLLGRGSLFAAYISECGVSFQFCGEDNNFLLILPRIFLNS